MKRLNLDFTKASKRQRKKKIVHRGSNFDEFLKENKIYKEVTMQAKKRAYG